jgi:hypothetical protein
MLYCRENATAKEKASPSKEDSFYEVRFIVGADAILGRHGRASTPQ